MSRVLYGPMENGTGFSAGPIDITPCVVSLERQPIYDGPCFMYSRHILKVRGVINAGTMSWGLIDRQDHQIGLPAQRDPILRPNLPGPPAAPAGYPANTVTTGQGLKYPERRDADKITVAITDQSIHDMLMQPRQVLIYSVNDQIVLLSPGLRGAEGQLFRVDAKNGPTPLACNVVQVRGTKTFVVDWAIETHLCDNDIFRQSQSISALVSHRWSMFEETDQDGFTTRTIRGHAFFRTDRLDQLTANPDDYRAWLFHPCPLNFKRDKVLVYPSEDNTRLDYVIVDIEKPINLTVGNGVTRIEAFLTQGIVSAVGLEEVNFQLGKMAVEAAALGAEAAAAALLLQPATPSSAQLIRTMANMAEIGWRAMPRLQNHATIRVWGNRSANRNGLYAVAMNVLLNRITALNLAIGKTSIMVTQDLMGKFVQIQADVESGPLFTIAPVAGAIAANPFGGAVQLAFANLAILGADDIAGVTTVNDADNPLLPNDPIPGQANNQGVRGSYIKEAVSRALQSDGGAVPGTTLPSQAVDPPVFTPRSPGNANG